jgi:hypothetical protein
MACKRHRTNRSVDSIASAFTIGSTSNAPGRRLDLTTGKQTRTTGRSGCTSDAWWALQQLGLQNPAERQHPRAVTVGYGLLCQVGTPVDRD